MYNYPHFAPKQTSARIDFLELGGRLVDGKGTHNVKFLTENETKSNCAVCTCVGNGIKHVRLRPPTRAVAGHAAHGQRRLHYGNAEDILGLGDKGIKKRSVDNDTSLLSLLSDSNQRPQDYKSCALTS